MMNIHDFLDKKHGKFIGRVYMLALLFLFNALIAVGAVMLYVHSMTPVVFGIGLVGTVACWAVLSTPARVDE